MSISASLVKELRQRTGSGMMECKKALVAANGDIEAAIEAMRKSGQAKADKKGGRIAAEGIVTLAVADDMQTAVMLELNCETDFVAREAKFQQFAESLANCALANKIDNPESLLAIEQEGLKLEEQRVQLVATLGENISLRRVRLLEVSEGKVISYAHKSATGVKIGVLVNTEGANDELARDVAMHIAAMNPEFLSANDVPAERVEKEKAIFAAQADELKGKPPAIVDKIVTNKVAKFTNEISLLGQPFVKESGKTVKQVLDAANTQVSKFYRFEVGEGIEKKQDNFVEDVMAQVKG